VIADLHCHYPMHVLAREPTNPPLNWMVRVGGRPRWLDRVRAFVLAVAARLFNYRRFSDRWRVSLDGLEQGGVQVVLSVLYEPFAEMDLDEWPGSKPEDGYYDDLRRQLAAVEAELRELDPGGSRHVVVRGTQELDDALTSGRVAVLHCIEGGFHLGGTVPDVERHVAELARLGVVYITLAHLFWRQVATNAPVLPFLSDRLYDRLFPQPTGVGLSDLGRAAVRAMYAHRVLVDVSHMRQQALDDTFDLLDQLDREQADDPRDFPVIASHQGFRFGKGTFMLSEASVRRIARRDGVIGLIFGRRQLNEGLAITHPDSLDGAVEAMRRHVDKIHTITGSHDHVAIGSDLDGFIRPTLGGIEYAEDLAKLRPPLDAAYPGAAEAILSGNALRVVRRALAAR
jgi:microsomal dipeptidase-like Zn-dependent dipeptidase